LIWLSGHRDCEQGGTKNKVNQYVTKPTFNHRQATFSDQNMGSIPSSCVS
jgi:hypothetical protein